MPRSFLYLLPIIGAITYLVTSFSNILMPALRLLKQKDMPLHYFLELFIKAFTNNITPSMLIFSLLIPILNLFKLNIVTLKNSLTIIGLVAVLKIIDMLLLHWIIDILFTFEWDYNLIIKIIAILVRFINLSFFVIPLIFLLCFLSRDLDSYEHVLSLGQKS